MPGITKENRVEVRMAKDGDVYRIFVDVCSVADASNRMSAYISSYGSRAAARALGERIAKAVGLGTIIETKYGATP